jgi:hypothetical protein
LIARAQPYIGLRDGTQIAGMGGQGACDNRKGAIYRSDE